MKFSNDMTYWVFTPCSLHFGVKIQTITTGKLHNLIPDLYSNLLRQDFICYSVHSCLSMIFLQHDVISLKEDLLRSNFCTLFLC
jgi:hypothetical protein